MKRILILMMSALILLAACAFAKEQTETEAQLTVTKAPTQKPAKPIGEPAGSTEQQPGEDYSESWRERPIPEAFDLRSVDTDGDGAGDRCFVPPVRNQRPFGSCWGFAATGAAEISILGSVLKYDPDGIKIELMQISEDSPQMKFIRQAEGRP